MIFDVVWLWYDILARRRRQRRQEEDDGDYDYDDDVDERADHRQVQKREQAGHTQARAKSKALVAAATAAAAPVKSDDNDDDKLCVKASYGDDPKAHCSHPPAKHCGGSFRTIPQRFRLTLVKVHRPTTIFTLALLLYVLKSLETFASRAVSLE